MAVVFLTFFRITIILCLTSCLSACANMLFYPSNVMVRTPGDVGVQYEDVYFHSGDNTLLHGWYLPAVGKAKGSVLFVHGNAENISTHLGSVYWLPSKGYNVFLFDYRGYGLSQGTPSLEGAVADVKAALKTLLQRTSGHNESIIVFGQSLGGALAIYGMATSKLNGSINALIVESTFASYRKIAQDKFASFILTRPFQWPLSLLIPDDFSPIRIIHQLPHIPLLVIHGDADQIVPIEHGRALYEAAGQPKEFWEIPNGRHTQAFQIEAYREKLLLYLQKVLSK